MGPEGAEGNEHAEPSTSSRAGRAAQVLLHLAGLAIVLVTATGTAWIGPQFDIFTASQQRKLIALGLVVVLSGLVFRMPRIALWTGRHSKVISILTSWVLILSVGAGAAELYARHSDGYLLFRSPLYKLYQGEQLRIYNEQAVATNPGYYRGFPFKVPTFRSNTPYPYYVFRPNQRFAAKGTSLVEAKPGDKVHWSSNSRGFRGAEVEVPKPADVVRVVALGASTTEGSSGNEDAYPRLLEAELARRLPGRRIEVVNAGHSGFDLRNILELWRTKARPLEPDFVVLYHLANDLNPQTAREFVTPPVPTASQAGAEDVRSVLARNSALYLKLFGAEAQPALTPARYEFDATHGQQWIDRYIETLRDLVREIQSTEATPVLSSFVTLSQEDGSFLKDSPYFQPFLDQYYPLTAGDLARVYTLYNSGVRDLAERVTIPFVDIAARFPRESKYFPFDLIHLTTEGNQLLAEAFADRLVLLLSAPQMATAPG